MKMTKRLFYKGKRLQKRPENPTISLFDILKNKTYLQLISLLSAATFLTVPISLFAQGNADKSEGALKKADTIIDEITIDITHKAEKLDYEEPLISLPTPMEQHVEKLSTSIKDSLTYIEPTLEESVTQLDVDSDTLAISDKKIDQEIQKRDIMKDQGWTKEMFDISCAVVLAESKALSYEDAYGVASTILNRTNSVKWNHSVDQVSGEGAGRNIYYQIIQPGQFEVYYKDLYVDFLPEVFPGDRGGYEDYKSVTDLPGYQAFLDCLTSKEPSHNFVNFCASNGKKANKVQLVSRGNLYYNELKPEDKIELSKDKTLTLTPNQM